MDWRLIHQYHSNAIRQLSLLSSLSWQHGMHNQQKMKANWEATPSIGRAHWHLASSFFITPRDFHDHSLVPLPIKLGIEDPLPSAQIEFAAGNRHYDLMMDQQRFEMRVAVVFTRGMMFVILAKRRQMFQPLDDVLDQAAFIVVNVDTRRDVHGRKP